LCRVVQDVVILVPYVGQLMAVRSELRRRKLDALLSAADREAVARDAADEDVAEAADGAGERARTGVRVATIGKRLSSNGQ
jgi:hypothetical protein